MDPLQVLQSLQSFYEASWNKLLWVVGAGFVFAGFIMPFLSQLYQRTTFNHQMKRIQDDASRQIEENKRALTETIDSLRKEIDESVTAETGNLAKRINSLVGGLNMVQGRIANAEGKYGLATHLFGSATNWLLGAEDYPNSTKSLLALKESLSKLTKQFFASNPEINDVMQHLIESLSDKKHENRYAPDVMVLSKLGTQSKSKEP